MNTTTRKLYYEDTHQTAFEAVVTAASEDRQGSYLELDQTAFYPEGGGQPCDMGTLAGLPVFFVKDAESGIRHYVKMDAGAALPAVGDTVSGQIDALRRKDMTEQHAGEHIVSGLICRSFSCDNVGFHIGEPFVTIDYNAEITLADLAQVEAEANRLIREDIPVHIFWPGPEELAALEYRSKKELSGAVRIVEYPDADICACCGTHVVRTGEIGLVKILSCQPHRGGVRIEMISGGRALSYLSHIFEENHKVSVSLSAKETETAAAVSRMLKENTAQRERLAALETEAIAAKAKALAGTGNVLLLESGMSVDSARRLAAEVLKTCGGFSGVLSDCGEDGIRYCLGYEAGGLRELSAKLNKAFNGRGGGQPTFVQGTLHGDVKAAAAMIREEIGIAE